MTRDHAIQSACHALDSGDLVGAVGNAVDATHHRQACGPAAQPGGALPNDEFMHGLGLPTLWVPHAYPGCSQHAPNEHLLPWVAREGLAIMAGLFWDLGDAFDDIRQLRRFQSQ